MRVKTSPTHGLAFGSFPCFHAEWCPNNRGADTGCGNADITSVGQFRTDASVHGHETSLCGRLWVNVSCSEGSTEMFLNTDIACVPVKGHMSCLRCNRNDSPVSGTGVLEELSTERFGQDEWQDEIYI